MTYREAFLTPRGFLIVGGVLLVAFGILGFFILNNPLVPFFWLDNAENVAHLALGAFALAAVYLPALNTALKPRYGSIVILLGVIALFVAAYGFLEPGGSPASPNTFGVTNLEQGDTLLNLVLATWAFLAVYWGPRRSMTGR